MGCAICGLSLPEGRRLYCSDRCYEIANAAQTKRSHNNNLEYRRSQNRDRGKRNWDKLSVEQQHLRGQRNYAKLKKKKLKMLDDLNSHLKNLPDLNRVINPYQLRYIGTEPVDMGKAFGVVSPKVLRSWLK
jgi:hypothetical protein